MKRDIFRPAIALVGLFLAAQIGGHTERAWGGPGQDGPGRRADEKTYMLVSAGAGDKNPLLKRVVLGPKGQRLGMIDTLIVDVKEGKIAYVVVALANGRLIPLPWKAFTFTTGDRTAILNVTEDQLEKTVIDSDVVNILGQ
jgi:sporulation protein YlmC with PRC-barrel domain